MKIGSLFSGYGGLEMGVQSVIGGTTAWVSDIDPGACKILAHRYPGVPNLGDISAVDWTAIEPVDVLTGGFPCQDVSHAGKRAGLKPDTRSGLWSAHLIARRRRDLMAAVNACEHSKDEIRRTMPRRYPERRLPRRTDLERTA